MSATTCCSRIGGAVHRVMIQLKLKTLTNSDVDVLTQYVQLMFNVAKALDKIQVVGKAVLRDFCQM